jgi:hypothetical protein
MIASRSIPGQFMHTANIGATPQAGLLYGSSGMAIAYHLLSACTKDPVAENNASFLLNQIGDNLASLTDKDFANGVAGVGWAIEWLVQNGFLKDVNTDEVLPDIDYVLYMDVTMKKQLDISLAHGAQGKAAYFIKRGKSKNPGTHRYRQLCHQECLVMLTDDLDEMLRGPEGVLTIKTDWNNAKSNNHAATAIFNVSFHLFLFGQLIKVNTPVLEKSLFDIMLYLEQFFGTMLEANDYEDILTSNRHLYYQLLHIATTYLYSALTHEHPHWLENAHRFIELLKNIDFPPENETEEDLYRKLTSYSLLNLYTPSYEYRQKAEDTIDRLLNQSPPFQLYRGLGSLLVSWLSLENPGLTRNWHELFYALAE